MRVEGTSQRWPRGTPTTITETGVELGPTVADSLYLCNYKDHLRCHIGIYRRLHPAEPSVVIGSYRKYILVRPDGTPGLSVREAAKLQGIADRFQFVGSIGFRHRKLETSSSELPCRFLHVPCLMRR